MKRIIDETDFRYLVGSLSRAMGNSVTSFYYGENECFIYFRNPLKKEILELVLNVSRRTLHYCIVRSYGGKRAVRITR